MPSASLLNTTRALSLDYFAFSVDVTSSDEHSLSPITTPGLFDDAVTVTAGPTRATSLNQVGFVNGSGASVTSGYVGDDWGSWQSGWSGTSSRSTSLFVARWLVTTPTEFTIEMSAVFPDFGGSTGSFGLVGGAPIVFVDPGLLQNDAASGVLAPGEYELRMSLNQDTAFDGITAVGRANQPVWSVDLRIPAPVTAGLVAMGGFAALRRRR